MTEMSKAKMREEILDLKGRVNQLEGYITEKFEPKSHGECQHFWKLYSMGDDKCIQYADQWITLKCQKDGCNAIRNYTRKH